MPIRLIIGGRGLAQNKGFKEREKGYG